MSDKLKLAFSYKPNQKNWIKIGLSFLVFYVAEAILFWRGGLSLGASLMKLPLANPVIYPLGFWGLFGYSIYFIQKRNPSGENLTVLNKRFRKWQSAILALGITTGVIGVAFTVMRVSGSVTLGHTAMFFALFLMALVIGGLELNVGWLSAALLWFLTALIIINYPAGFNMCSPYKDEDMLIGLVLTVGFILIGALPYYVNEGQLKEKI